MGFTALLLAIICFAGRATPLAECIAAASIVTVCGHAVMALGWKDALSFAAICLTVAFSIENTGVLTGFPFGHYAFLVEPNIPHIGVIPPIVGPLYLGMGYPAWVIANLLLGQSVQRPSTGLQLFGVPVISAFVMVQWDVVMDPSGSTLARAWVWYDSGGYFGVPLSNFLGWFLVTYLYSQAFSFLLYARRALPPYPSRPYSFWLWPILLYLSAGLCHVPPLFDRDSRLIDGGGRVWSASDLRETAMVVMLFTMLPTSILAMLRLVRPGAPAEERLPNRVR
jgi:putative membrane protein